MHPVVFDKFDQICRTRGAGGRVLEVGATPDASTLLNLPALAASDVRVGVNKAGAATFRGMPILPIDANAMHCFADASFDTVLCNAVLEHDPFFWRSLAEMKRVLRPGGLLAIGTPGFTRLPYERRLGRLRRWLPLFPWRLPYGTLTLGVHRYPEDYYRFSEAAFRDVFFEGMVDVTIGSVLVPPRIIGAGRRS